ncbi:MAG TPA: GGDEF domain-containing protein [Burkholderiaceae bacterium]|nr:GGDEF domain-containing protein [Burkholderiaceae bacterium]
MNETRSSVTSERAESARSLAGAVGADEAVLAGALFDVLDRLNAFVSIKDVASGRYLHANARMAELFGREPGDTAGLTDADLFDPAQVTAIRSAEQTVLAGTVATSAQQRFERNGQRREFNVTRIALPRDDGGAPRHVLTVWTETTAEHQREQQLQHALSQLEQQQQAAEMQRRELQDQALRDAPTGLYQRAHFEDQLRREVDLSSREHREFALVMIVLDPFSEAVQAAGAEARNRILEALGRLLRGNTRAMDASCRLDDSRFAILLSGVGLATAHSRMEGLRRQCATQIVVLDGRDLGFTVSMGVASFPHTANSETELLRAADNALDEARKRGGNHVTLASIRFELGAT